jgi:hypothetical protein
MLLIGLLLLLVGAVFALIAVGALAVYVCASLIELLINCLERLTTFVNWLTEKLSK